MDRSCHTGTPPRHEDEDSSHGQSDDDLIMFDTDVQMLTLLIISLIITN
jgi:hypothetical protein